MPPHIQIGARKSIAIVFSCPGRHEQIAERPAAKTTGRNLDILLSILSNVLGRSDLIRHNITITNAWPRVEYKALTGRSEATENEVITQHNIERLEQELLDVTEFVIFCGDRAKIASHKLLLEKCPKRIYVEHLGTRGLLSIKNDVYGQPIVAAGAQKLAGTKMSKRQIQNENTERRLEVVANEVVKQLQLKTTH